MYSELAGKAKNISAIIGHSGAIPLAFGNLPFHKLPRMYAIRESMTTCNWWNGDQLSNPKEDTLRYILNWRGKPRISPRSSATVERFLWHLAVYLAITFQGCKPSRKVSEPVIDGMVTSWVIRKTTHRDIFWIGWESQEYFRDHRPQVSDSTDIWQPCFP